MQSCLGSGIFEMERLLRIAISAIVCVLTALPHGCAYNLDTEFPIIFRSTPGSYFGYTVALHRNRDGPLALVGAPRANSSILLDQLNQPGVLYQCDVLKSENCREVVLDRKGNTQADNRDSEFLYYDKKDGMWLGVSLDVQQNSARNDIVTCGHLWKNQFYKSHYLVNGVCYVIDGDLDPNRVTKLVPFVEKSKQAITPPGIYKYAFGQVGTSAAFTEDGNYLLLGAPGYYDWTGTVVSYPLNPNTAYQSYPKPAVPTPPFEHNVSPESYIGYSVTSGKFFDNELDYVAVGAPRDGDFQGRVYIYEAIKSGEKKLNVHQKKEGMQLGEYFGASVLGMNLNGDKYTDLIVGAPLYSSENGVDEGKVYIFISNGMGLQLFAQLFGKSKSNARFGTALANLGDLNQDGYNDLAVGAPYEDEKGSVYIYHGSPSGLNVQYAQRISAVETDSSLLGFGIHIARGFDIDNNQYPDVLVGSYASSNAVLFRARPVVQLSSKITFSPKQINTNLTNCVYQNQNLACVNVTVCLWYAGKHVPLYLDFQHDVFVEYSNQAIAVLPRGFFVRDSRAATVIQHNARLNIGTDYCSTDTLYIRPDIKDVITPIQLMYRYDLQSSNMSRAFTKSLPIIDPASPQNVSSLLSFQTGCGTDDKCLSDLSVGVIIIGHADNSPIVIGEKSTLSLAIEVANSGEPAYLSELLIHLPPELPSINQDICSSLSDLQDQRKNATLVCDLGNPLLKDKAKLQIKLDLTKIPTYKKNVEIRFEAITASNEINPKDNVVIIPLRFKALADISITGSPSHEQVPYDEKTASFIPISITHTYFVMNHGPSPVQILDFVLHIPTSIQRNERAVDFVAFTNLETDSGQALVIPAQCNDTFLPIQQTKPVVENAGSEIFKDGDLVPRKENGSRGGLDYGLEESEFSSEEAHSRSRRSGKEAKSSKRKKEITINCDTSNCMTIQCSASPFSDTRKFAKISVSVQLNLSVLDDYLDPWYRLEYITSGEVYLREENNGVIPKHHHPDQTMVKTIIVASGPPGSEEVAQWIIFVSIGVGILLLIIILVLLIKFGFFKREQRDKMEEMMSKEPNEGENTESEALN